MSVVLDKPITDVAYRSGHAPVIDRPRAPFEPQVQPWVRPVPQSDPTIEIPAKPVSKPKTDVARLLLVKSMLFLGVFAMTWVGNTLAGQYMVEKSRNEARVAGGRAAAALQAETEVRRHIDTLTSSASIEQWALSHSFHPTDGLGQTSKVVDLDATSR